MLKRNSLFKKEESVVLQLVKQRFLYKSFNIKIGFIYNISLLIGLQQCRLILLLWQN